MKTITQTVALTMTSLAGFLTPASAQVVAYSETFDPTGSTRAFDTANLQALAGTGGTILDASITSSQPGFSLSIAIGGTSGRGFVGATTVGDSTEIPTLVFNTDIGTIDASTAFSFSLDASTNNNNIATVRIALGIDTDANSSIDLWLASADSINTLGTGTGDLTTLTVVQSSNPNYFELDVTADTILGRSDTIADTQLSGDILGFGLFVENYTGSGNGGINFDNFSISTIPEPSHYAMLVVAIAFIGLKLRSRKHRA